MIHGTGTSRILAWLWIFAWPPALIGEIINPEYGLKTLGFGTAVWIVLAMLLVPPLFSSPSDVEEENKA